MDGIRMTCAEMAAPRYSIGKVRISAVTMDKTLQLLDQQVQTGKPAYVCVADRISALLSQEDEEYCQIQNSSFLTIPDGMPLVWFARLAGVKNVKRVTGPDLMLKILELSKERNYSHYFLGDTEETLTKMIEVIINSYTGIDIKGSCSPPFRPLTDTEIENIAREINCLKPSFVWVALGAPKQERFMVKLLPLLEESILVGVGAAFRFIIGEYKHPAKLLQICGLEGFCWRFWRAPFYYTKRYILDGFALSCLTAKMLLSRVWKGTC